VGQVKNLEKVVVLGTGGTIAGTAAQASDHVVYNAAQLSVEQLMTALPHVQQVLGGRTLVVEQVAQLDSKDMDLATWQALARRCFHWLGQADVHAVVITHGTDTVEETAWFLQEVLPLSKPVVLTCAMRPATALAADGPQNLMDALAVASDQRAGGVTVVCAGVIHSARQVQKLHPYRLDAFSSGEAGPLGWVEAGLVRWSTLVAPLPDGLHSSAGQALVLQTPVNQWPVVDVVSHAGATRRAVDALVRTGAQGLVVACTGNGTVHHEIEAALEDAEKQGVQVRRSTRCAQGQLVGATGHWPDADGLSPVKARIRLMLQLLASKP
jgi:L-asparaginase